MKSLFDPRHVRRKKIVESLFSKSFFKLKPKTTKTPLSASQKVISVNEILEKHTKIDKIIEKIAPEFPIININKIDLAILRLAVFELSIEKKEPPKVIIDEAVELAKEFGGDSSPGFINGALGNLVKNNK